MKGRQASQVTLCLAMRIVLVVPSESLPKRYALMIGARLDPRLPAMLLRLLIQPSRLLPPERVR